jgi:hypothetical protein
LCIDKQASRPNSEVYKYNVAFLEIGKKVEYCGLPMIAVITYDTMLDSIEEECGEDACQSS